MTTRVKASVLDTNAVFETGTKLCFYQSSAPTGWIQIIDDTSNNRLFRVVSGTGGGYGGSHSPILMDVIPAHTHTYSGTSQTESESHTHSFSGTTGGGGSHSGHSGAVQSGGHGGSGWYNGGDQFGLAFSVANHTHSFSGTSNTASATHTHAYSGTTASNLSSSNWTPRYIDLILCSKT